MLVRSLCHVTIELRELFPTDVDEMNVEELVDHCEKAILEQKWKGAQTVTLCATTAQEWSTHQRLGESVVDVEGRGAYMLEDKVG